MAPSLLKGMVGHLGKVFLDHLILPGNCVVFTFHRILSESAYQATTFQRSIAVTDVALGEFVRQLHTRFDIISLQEMMAMSSSPADRRQRPYACITLDDGWQDNYTHGFPVLKAQGVPATIFLSSDYIGSYGGFWWQNLGDALSRTDLAPQQVAAIDDVLRPLLGKGMPSPWAVDSIIETIKTHHYDDALDITQAVLSIAGQTLQPHGLQWSQCMEMSKHQISFGSHTMSHPRLSLLSEQDIDKELRHSKSTIQSKGLRYVNAICYPYGDVNEKVQRIAAQHYDAGVTTALGVQSMAQPAGLTIPRVNVSNAVALYSSRLNYRLLRASLKSRK